MYNLQSLRISFSALVIAGAAMLTGAQAQDVEAGKRVFNQCRACHQVGDKARNGVGPTLNGVFGHKSGQVKGYNYSKANKESGITWDEKVFAEYIKNPPPENSRHQDGIRRPEERQADCRPHRISEAICRGRFDQEVIAAIHAAFAKKPGQKCSGLFVCRLKPKRSFRCSGVRENGGKTGRSGGTRTRNLRFWRPAL